jgi:hypothetical protein
MTHTDRFGTAAPGILAQPAPIHRAVSDKTHRATWPWWLAALVSVAAATCGGTWWVAHRGETTLWVTTRPVAEGDQITAADVRALRVTDAETAATEPTDDDSRGFAITDLPAGVLLTEELLSANGAQPDNTALVGLALAPGQAPTGDLHPGDRLRLIYAPAAVSSKKSVRSEVLAPSATVWEARMGDDGTRAVTVVLPRQTANRVALHAAVGEVAAVRVD